MTKRVKLQDLQVLRTFTLRAFTQDNAELILDFRREAIKNGETTASALFKLMKEYVKEHKAEVLYSETELLERLKKEGYPTVKSTIKKYRREKQLKSGVHYFTNEVDRVVYVWKEVKKFLDEK